MHIIETLLSYKDKHTPLKYDFDHMASLIGRNSMTQNSETFLILLYKSAKLKRIPQVVA